MKPAVVSDVVKAKIISMHIDYEIFQYDTCRERRYPNDDDMDNTEIDNINEVIGKTKWKM